MVAVGKARPPYADDLQHYAKLLSRHARVDVIEVADDDALERRIPERAYVCLLDSRGRSYTSEAFAGWLEERRQAGRDVCFVIGGAFGVELAGRRRSHVVVRTADASAHARARRAPRAALPSAQDPRQRAVPSLAVHPVDELRAAVEAAAGDLRNGKPAPTTRASLERPKKAGFGDYSTNAAMLLAPALGAPPREIAERLGEKLSERLGEAVERVEVAGPGFLNVFLADAWYVGAARQVVAAGDDWGRGDAGAARERQRRVRLREPDRPADRRQRPPRRLRRRDRAHARARRPRGQPRVLLQQRRVADRQARRVGAPARPPRAGARGRRLLRRRLRDGGRAADPGRRRGRRRSSSAPRPRR